MLTREHLVLGLNALSRAHGSDYFADGHRGAAMIAAYYLCQRPDIATGAVVAIAAMVSREWSASELFAPPPNEAPDPSLTVDIGRALVASTDRLREAGHNVIFPSLVLKAMADVPEAVTPSCVDGICALIQAFTAEPETLFGDDVALPDLADLAALAEFALTEALQTMRRFEARGQGWTGHLLTHSHAVVDLVRSGHPTVAQHALAGLAHYVKRIRMGPGECDRAIPERSPVKHSPLTERYWQGRCTGAIGLGHCFKYPYAFYSLLDLVTDPALRRRLVEEAYRVL